MPTLKEFEYTAFISYAHADDEAWYGWVTCFRNELERGLRALLRGQHVPQMHLSGDNGPIAGVLGEALQQRVAASFAMIIVVHENYAQSTWCLKELAYFKTLFGEQGLRERLYIVALSEAAIQRVSQSAAWQTLLPGGEQLWLPFYDPADPLRPLDIYMSPGIVANAFRTPFERLRGDLAAKLRRLQLADAKTPPFDPLATAPVLPAPAPPAAPAATPAGGVLMGLVPPSVAAAASAAVARLSSQGVPVRSLGFDAVLADFAEFDTATHLVLACDDAPLMMTSMAGGGHLQLQRDAWLRKGRPADHLLWLDLRAAAPGSPASAGTGFAASLGANLLDTHSLAALLQPKPAAAPAQTHSSVRIYIESNRNERTLWEALGEQIRRRWDSITREFAPERVPPLTLRPRGLPVDQIDTFPNLDDADGVVLLWGKKTSDALVAQINKVENKMAPGRDAAPGIVAYLMPPQQASEPIPAWGWQVLRFDAHDEEAIDVVAEERDEMTRFLRKVLRRCQLREAGAGAGP